MRYNKMNLHSGMMARVGRQNDKVYDQRMKEYHLKKSMMEKKEKMEKEKVDGIQPKMGGESVLKDLNPVNFIKEPSSFVKTNSKLTKPQRMKTRNQRVRMQRGRY